MRKNGEKVASYAYDALNHRVMRQGRDGSKSYYAYGRQGALAYQYEEGKDKERSIVYAGAMILGWTEDAGEATTTFYAVTDNLGSVTQVQSGTGVSLWESEYLPFGQVAGANGSLPFDGFYTGKDVDPDTGLRYHWNRWTSEDGSRFMSEDPARDGGNWYGYCRNNPQNIIDENGLSPKFIGLVYEITGMINGMRAYYVGSTAQQLNMRLQAEKPEVSLLLNSLGTKVKVYQVYGDLDIAASGRGTKLSAQNEALRSVEQEILNKARESTALELNSINAATKEHTALWKERHNVSIAGNTKVSTGIKITIGGVVIAATALHLFREYVEEKGSHYIQDWTKFEDERGTFEVKSIKLGLLRPWTYFKEYINEEGEGRFEFIDKKQYKAFGELNRELYGYIDWKGDFVPGKRQESVPKIDPSWIPQYSGDTENEELNNSAC